MANKVDGEVSIRLDRTRTLYFGFRGHRAFQKLRGRPIAAVFNEVFKMRMSRDPGEDLTPEEAFKVMGILGYDVVCDMLWAGLLHEDPDLAPDDAADLMDKAEGNALDEKYLYVLRKVREAFMATTMRPGREEEAAEKKTTT